MVLFKLVICAGIFCCCMNVLYAQTAGTTRPKDGLGIIGNLGTSANFYKSNEDDYIASERNFTRPYFAWNVYGSLVARYKDLSIPISLVVNQYSKSNLKPYFQMGISPTYKWAKLHLGYRNISFSPLTFDGQSFRGAGIELTPKFFRFAAFYGRLNKSVTEDTATASFRMPQFSRTGYGVKVGIGSQSTFLDIMYFHAKDDSASSKSLNSLPAQENAVLGSSFKITIKKRIALTADVALSGLTKDQSFIKLNLDSSNKVLKDAVGRFLNYNASTVGSYAGQSALTLNFRGFYSNIGYRRVEPDFKSLGTPYLLNDVELVSWQNNLSFAKGKVNVNTNLSSQHNNLNKTLTSELQTRAAGINVNTMLDPHTNINFNYSGYDFKQVNGTVPVKDSFRLAQKTSQYTINPAYNITKGNKLHYISGNLNLSILKDQNRVSSALLNTTLLSSSLNYMLSLINKPYSFSINGSYSKYNQAANSYTSYGATIGTSAQLFKQKNLNIEGNIGYLINDFNSGSAQKNITYAITAGYQMKKHALNLFANYVYTPPNTINAAINGSITSAVVSKNLASGISYNYYF